MNKFISIIVMSLFISSVSMGTAPRYKVSVVDGFSTVVDEMTGLTWQQSSTIDAPVTWADALAGCETLEYAGFTDWRLPQVPELLSIVDEKRIEVPAVNTSYFVDFKVASGYWTSTTHRINSSSAYVVFFNEQNVTSGRGGVGTLDKSSKAQVLCVRTTK